MTEPNPDAPGTQPADLDLRPHEVELTQREIQAVQLRAAGLQFHEIATALGWQTKSAAFKAVQRALQKWGVESVDEMRQVETARLDTLTRRLWPMALGKDARPASVDQDGTIHEEVPAVAPDLNAIALLLRISERRSRLHGLDQERGRLDTLPDDGTPLTVEMVDDYESFLRIVDDVAQHRVIEHDPAGGELPAGGGQAGVPTAEDPVQPARAD